VLTPALGNERPTKTASSAARPSDWREATVFAARDGNTSRAAFASPDRSAVDTSPPVPALPSLAAGAQPDGLFVTRNTPGLRP
jgi:hypothetical protein